MTTPQPLTPDEIAALRKLHEEATAGPWFIEGSHMDYAIMGNRTGSQDGWAIAENVFDLDARRKDAARQERDANLAIALRNAAPRLLAACERDTQIREAASQLIAKMDEGEADSDDLIRFVTLVARLP